MPHQLLKGLTKHLRMTKSWGVKCCWLKDEFSNDLPGSNHQEPALLPDAIGEFNVDVSQPKLIDFVDAGHGSELREQRSITGWFSLSWEVQWHVKAKPRFSLHLAPQRQTEFIAAFTAAKAA